MRQKGTGYAFEGYRFTVCVCYEDTSDKMELAVQTFACGSEI